MKGLSEAGFDTTYMAGRRRDTNMFLEAWGCPGPCCLILRGRCPMGRTERYDWKGILIAILIQGFLLLSCVGVLKAV